MSERLWGLLGLFGIACFVNFCSLLIRTDGFDGDGAWKADQMAYLGWQLLLFVSPFAVIVLAIALGLLYLAFLCVLAVLGLSDAYHDRFFGPERPAEQHGSRVDELQRGLDELDEELRALGVELPEP